MSDAANNLPRSWAWTTIGEVTELSVQQAPPDGDAPFLYVDISSIDNGARKIVDPKTILVTEAPSRARQRLKLHDVLVSMTRPNLNAIAILPAELEGAIGSTGFDVLRTDWIEPRWLLYFVQTDDFVHAMSRLVQGVLYPAVRPRDIRSYRLPLAPLSEQRRIVSEIEKQFTRLEAGVAALKRVQTNLKSYRAAVLKAAVEGRLVPTEAELARREGRAYEPASELLKRILAERRARWEASQLTQFSAAGELPTDESWKRRYKEPSDPRTADLPGLAEGWTYASLEQVTVLVYRYPTFYGMEHLDGGVPVIRGEHILPRGRISSDRSGYWFVGPEVSARYPKTIVDVGDIVMSVRGSVGKFGIVDEAVCGAQVSPNCLRISLFKAHVLPNWFYIFFSSAAGLASVSGQINQTTIETIKASTFTKSSLALPPLPEQARIVAEVDRRLSVTEELETEVEADVKRADRLRQAILNRAFEGKLVPQDPNDEPASVLLERIRAERSGSRGTATPGCAPLRKCRRPRGAR